jgi:hypothetical protein
MCAAPRNNCQCHQQRTESRSEFHKLETILLHLKYRCKRGRTLAGRLQILNR